jgi:hydroxypyruvate isomerase
MKRRDFLKGSVLTAGAEIAASSLGTQDIQASAAKHQFKLKYASHFNMLQHSAGNDPVDQLKYAADLGFTAWADNGM